MNDEKDKTANSPDIATRLIHRAYQPPAGFAAANPAIHHAATVIFPNVALMRARDWQSKQGYTYGLHGTPTSFTLEAQLVEIEKARHCLLTPSGLSAISLVNFSFLQAGDEVLVPENAYQPNAELAAWLAKFQVSCRTYPASAGAEIADYFTEKTRLIWAEVPGSISMEVADLPALAAAAKTRGILLALDNTWSAGLAFDGFAHGADIIIQALTKYQSGGSDVLMGAVLVRDQHLYVAIQRAHMVLGLGVGMDDAYLILRNLPSMKLRFEAHDKAARAMANWFSQRPEIARVLHPALPDCPGHAIWQRDFTGAGAVFSVLFDAKYSATQIDGFVDSLSIFKLGYSWGGAISLVMPYTMQNLRENWPHQGQLVRFYIGLEALSDLQGDISQALNTLSQT